MGALLLVLLVAVLGWPRTTPPPARTRADPVEVIRLSADSLRTLYEAGRPFPEFLAAARSRREEWHLHYRAAQVPDSLLTRARAVQGTWYLLAVAEDWCGDSANTIPYLARLAERVDGLDMQVIDSRQGRGLMEAHRTPDGRPATPTVLLLDAGWNEVGSLVERPAPLMEWYQAHRADMSSDDLHEHIYEWYDRDRGASTLAQVIGMMETARSAGPVRIRSE
jgi:hypothetical protein